MASIEKTGLGFSNMSLLELAGVVMFILKITGDISWSWWVVFSPVPIYYVCRQLVNKYG